MTCAICGAEMEWAQVPVSVPEYVAGTIVDRETFDYVAYCPNQDCLVPGEDIEQDDVPF